MQMRGLAFTLGVGAAVGAIAVMMLPRQCTARRVVDKAAEKVEDAAYAVSDKISQKLDSM